MDGLELTINQKYYGKNYIDMSSFHKKNPLIDKIIKSKEFQDDIPKNIKKVFIQSVMEGEEAEPTGLTQEGLEKDIELSDKCPLFLISKNVQRAAAQIDAEKVKDIFDLQDLPFQRAVISLGSDTDGMYYTQSHTVREQTFLSFTFLAGSTATDMDRTRMLGNIVSRPIQFLHSKEKSGEFENTMTLLKILIYLHYGDITTKTYGKKEVVVTGSRGPIRNTTDYDITFVNTLWKQRVSTAGFAVRGHWRLQPYGTRDNSKHRLLWIEEFEKSGYNRKATKETKYETTT